MLSLRPDFLLAYGDFDYSSEQGLATLEELGTAGVQVYTVVCPDPEKKYTNETLETTYRTVLDLGKIFGVSDRAERRVAEMKAQIAEVSQKVRDQPRAQVMAHYFGEGPVSVAGGRSTLTTQIIEAAGGENVFADQVPFFDGASLETITAKKVDAFIIFPSSEEPTGPPETTKEAQFLFKTFPNLKASKDRRVIAPGSTAPGWRNAQTVEDLARQLHPEAFR